MILFWLCCLCSGCFGFGVCVCRGLCWLLLVVGYWFGRWIESVVMRLVWLRGCYVSGLFC